jgi:hypothetical protein
VKNLKQLEEDRRERHWDPQVRWRVLQDTITWADAQATSRRNTPAYQLAAQAEKLGRLNDR